MSTAYFATDPRTLADRLADDLDAIARQQDLFTPAVVVVPNRYLRKWLRLRLARRLGVAINLDMPYLEDGLWRILAEVDPVRTRSTSAEPIEAIDDNIYRLMALAVLLEEDDPNLERFRRYVQLRDDSLTRLTCRRAWYLADQLGTLLREYEYHRQDMLIQRWLKGEFGLGRAGEFHKAMERAQRAMFLHITREPGGKRAVLNRLSKQTFKTFPQYAMELMTGPPPTAGKEQIVHFFGFTHISELHARTIAWLGRQVDVRFHHLNVLSSQLPETPTVDALIDLASRPPATDDLSATWGRAGRESLATVANFLHAGFDTRVLSEFAPKPTKSRKRTPPPTSVLARLHLHMHGRGDPDSRFDQDRSLQIISCPDITREVETVYNSIVHNLHDDPALRQTDIAVLVTDMSKYRAVVQAVFDRPPRRVHYNLVDFSAAGASVFAQALLGMLDLALESFSRSRVFAVILNPCFLTRLGVDRGQAIVWLEWAQQLGIHQGWDADEKHEQGYARSPFYAWRLGLQRLRLGRFMETAPEERDEPARRFGHVIPFADIESTDREQLDFFCRAVEGLLPTLARLRSAPMTGLRWAHALERLVQEFLDVPPDRPEEAQVRSTLLASFEKLATWDSLHAVGAGVMPLALVREYVLSQLEALEGNRGEYLVGGVTIAALEPMRPVPFEIIYVIGLSDNLFPGSNALSSFDLRGADRSAGDIRPAEQKLYDLLATVHAARRKLYLLHTDHDPRNDQTLQPAAAIEQLQAHLNRFVISQPFKKIRIPAQADDGGYLDPARQPAYQDVLVQVRDADRYLAILAAESQRRIEFDPIQQAEWDARKRTFAVDFSIPATTGEPAQATTVVPIGELAHFLFFPALASLRRHLHVEEERDQPNEDHEPLVSPKHAEYALVGQAVQQLVLSAVRDGVENALASWQERFTRTYEEWRLRSRVPEDAFGAIDQQSLLTELIERVNGQGALATFLRERAASDFCGPVLLGESLTPLGARLRFPALRLRPGHELPATADRTIRIVGSTQFAWQAPGRFEMLIVTHKSEIKRDQIDRPLFEPALLYLALLASIEPNADGIIAGSWLSQRECVIHVSHNGGVQSWSYPPGCITPAEATHFLAELARDLLDVAQFDVLPFSVLLKSAELRRAFDSLSTSTLSAEQYYTVLEDAVADARENTFVFVAIPPLVDAVGARIPTDALAKVRRRFLLLDRGPARIREQPAPPPTRKKRGQP